MKKKLTSLIIAAVVAAILTVPTLACTPPLNSPSSPHIEFNWEPSEEFQAGIKHGVDKYLEEHPIDLKKETETETETEEETEKEAAYVERCWKDLIPNSLKSRWFNKIVK